MAVSKLVDKVSVIARNSLSKEQKEEFDIVQEKGYSDPFLKGAETNITGKMDAMVIIHDTDKQVIGFLVPERTSYKGQRHWRSGAVYLKPEYRGRGIMFNVLQEFFLKHNPALAWIDDSNNKSINLFTKLGFIKHKPKDHDGVHGHWYILTKMNIGNEVYSW